MIPALGVMRHKDAELEGSLGYIAKHKTKRISDIKLTMEMLGVLTAASLKE